MRKTAVHALAVFCMAFHAVAAQGADVSAATRPTAIDQILKIPPIRLRTKGVTPKEAFKMLSDVTGITFVSAERVARGRNGASVPIDLWGGRKYPGIDFDLDSVSFWQALDRINARADMEVYGADRWMTLYPGHGPDAQTQEGLIYDNPVYRAHLRAVPDYLTIKEPHLVKDIPANFHLWFDLDPRVRVFDTLVPLIESTQDDLEREVVVLPVSAPEFDSTRLWHVSVDLSGKVRSNAKRLAALSGVMQAKVVLKSQEIVVPMMVGAKVAVGPWKLELLDFRSIGSNLGRSSEIELEVEPMNNSSPPVPADLRTLVELRDESGASLTRNDFAQTDLHTTATGGVRQRMEFWWARWDQNAAKPAKLVFFAPTEFKEAALPFEFKDVKLP